MNKKINSIVMRTVVSVFVFCYSFVQAPTALTAVGLSDLIDNASRSMVAVLGTCAGTTDPQGVLTCSGTCPDANKTCKKLKKVATGGETCLCIEPFSASIVQ